MMDPVHGQMTVMVLIKLLEKQRRLPCPRECPHEVKQRMLHIMSRVIFQKACFSLLTFSLNQQVKVLMDQCWDTDPAQRPLFKSLIERIEAIRRTYDWQSNMNFSLAQIC